MCVSTDLTSTDDRVSKNRVMPVRVEVPPALYRWARERSRLPEGDIIRRFPKFTSWVQGTSAPTLKQLEGFANATHTSVGFFFLREPPVESVPVPDYRTIRDEPVGRPSADLLDTIFQCQQRQEWYHDFARGTGEDPVSIVGALSRGMTVPRAADQIRSALSFDVDDRGSNWSEALRRLVERVESLGVLVMINGVVGSNTHRRLNPSEFRGFSLVDDLAPLIFINGADTKSAQIFTIVHELTHIWLGESALDDVDVGAVADLDAERWINQVTGEVLVPLDAVRAEYRADAASSEELDRLAKIFKASTLVVLRRVYDGGFLTWNGYRAAYESELARIREFLEARESTGGNFYNTQPVRASRRFAQAVISSTLEGQTLHRDALQMLGFKKLSTFHELATRLGVG